MSHFREFEKEAVRLLASPTLGSFVVEAVLRDSEFVSYEYSGVGYFLTVRHSLLPAERTAFSEPFVLGRAGTLEGGYLVFVKNGELMLECYSAGADEVPSDFKDRSVTLEQPNPTFQRTATPPLN